MKARLRRGSVICVAALMSFAVAPRGAAAQGNPEPLSFKFNTGQDVYPIFYVGAQSTGGGAPTFFAGTVECTDTTPGNCKVIQYPAKVAATGSVAGNTISITVPLANGFGRPIHGTRLYNATAFTFGRDDDTTDLYADVDASPPFDVRLR